MTDLPPAPAADASPDLARRRAFRVLFLIVLADMIGFGIIIPVLPIYARDFGASNWQVTMLLSVHALCQFVASPLLGSLSDRIGRRPVLVFSQFGSGLAAFVLAYATWKLGGHAIGLWVIYAARMLDGFSGGNMSAAQAYVSDTVGPKEKAKFMGLLGAAFGIGFTLGPAVGGVLGHFNAALAPLAAGLFSLTAAVLSYRFLPESLKAPVVHTESHLKRSIALLREPVLTQINVIWFLSMFAFVTTESIFALFLTDDFAFPSWKVGFMFGLSGLVIIIVQGRLIGPLTRRLGEWNVATLGPLVFAVGAALFFVTTHEPILPLLIVATLANATGRSLQTPALSTLISHQSPPGQQGAAFGLFQGFGALSRVAGPAVAGLLYDRKHAWPYVVAGSLALFTAFWTLTLRAQTTRRGDDVPAAAAD